MGKFSSIDDDLAGKIPGVILGIVSSNKDEENLGRVQVRLPWGNKESIYAKVATFSAGIERGGFFLPEEGDEVLLAFEQGYLDYPYVIGSLWNKDAKPPLTQDGKNNIKAFKSRGGNEVVFCDEKGKEMVKIHTKAGHTILLDDGGKVLEIKTNGDLKITMDDNKKAIGMTAGDSTIKMEPAGITISCNGKLDISASDIQINAKANMNVKGNAMANFESSGPTVVKGAIVKIN